jgi:hypothetical protein
VASATGDPARVTIPRASRVGSDDPADPQPAMEAHAKVRKNSLETTSAIFTVEFLEVIGFCSLKAV